MPDYRRAFSPGGTFFFTLVTEARVPIFSSDRARRTLRDAIEACRIDHPFRLDAMVLLPDHLHLIWTLPPQDADFSLRMAAIKARFTRAWLDSGGSESPTSPSRQRRGRRGVWQRSFWEHLIRDETDLARHLHYIHYNPVKHALVACPHAWPYSTLAKWTARQVYDTRWLCCCGGRQVVAPDFSSLANMQME